MTYASRISGTGSFLPKRKLSNFDLESTLETTNEWILERTGIAYRHIASDQEATSDLACEASRRALEAADLNPRQLDAILVATVTPDHALPNTACLLQARLGCPSLMALDVSAACSGFLYALSVADHFIKAGTYQNILVIGAETLSRIVNYKDRQTCILFGDGAGAVVLSRAREDESSSVFSSHLHATGDVANILTVPAGGSRLPLSSSLLDENLNQIQMKGREVFKAAVRSLAERCREALTFNRLSATDIKWYLVHQANMRIIEATADSLGLKMDSFLLNVAETGNTSSASIPILLDESIRSGRIGRGDLLAMAAFGAGLTSAATILRY